MEDYHYEPKDLLTSRDNLTITTWYIEKQPQRKGAIYSRPHN